jgi:GTP-binding protein
MTTESPSAARLPCVAIVGRPNVGKSTLFNALAGRRIAIEEPTRGVTRDRVTATVEHEERHFELVDTGGIGVVDSDGLSEHVERQIGRAIERADLFLFVADSKEGARAEDQDIANRLRETARPVLLVANKVDVLATGDRGPDANARVATQVADFHRLAVGEPLPVSAVHRRGILDLLDAIVEALPSVGEAPLPQVAMKLAIVGRRNVGKSTLVNAIAGEERVIVSEFPGTTRDAVDVRFEKDGKAFVAIDTAGVRKKRRLANSVEFYSMVRAQKSIERADVILFLLDVTDDIVELDRRLGGEIAESGKPCVIVGNKWDLAKGRMSTEDYADYVAKRLPMLGYAPLTFTTATSGRRVWPTIELAQQLYKQAHLRAPTAEVNRALREAVEARSPKPQGSRLAKFYYATQVSAAPPTIVVFVNDPKLVAASYRRYLAGAFRHRLSFSEVPIRLLFRGRRRVGRR